MSNMAKPLARFSAGLYCGGVDRHCPLPGGRRGRPGECFWLRQEESTWRAVVAADLENRSMDPDQDRWDPAAYGQKGFHRLDKHEAARCLRGRRILVVGDSTTREVYTALTAQAGAPVVRRMRWSDGEWEPAHRWHMSRRWEVNRSVWFADHTHDRHGTCSFSSRCVRDELLGADEPGRPAGHAGFVFVMPNTQEELSRFQRLLVSQPWEAVLVQCPFWHFFAPQAYNYTISRSARKAFVRLPLQAPAGPIGFGKSCAQYVGIARRQLPEAQIFVLGLYQMGTLGGMALLPNGQSEKVRARSTTEFEEALLHELHDALEVRCERRGNGYAITHTLHGATMLDRYNLVGPSGARTRDGAHLHTGASHALVQHMLNWMCPSG